MFRQSSPLPCMAIIRFRLTVAIHRSGNAKSDRVAAASIRSFFCERIWNLFEFIAECDDAAVCQAIVIAPSDQWLHLLYWPRRRTELVHPVTQHHNSHIMFDTSFCGLYCTALHCTISIHPNKDFRGTVGPGLESSIALSGYGVVRSTLPKQHTRYQLMNPPLPG